MKSDRLEGESLDEKLTTGSLVRKIYAHTKDVKFYDYNSGKKCNANSEFLFDLESKKCKFMIISIHQKDEVAMTTTFILGQSQQYKKKVAITLNHKSATQNR